MPKKFTGMNSKAAEARARRAGEKAAVREKELKAKEDAFWADDDKNLARKANRQEEAQRKKEEQERKRAELAEIVSKEEEENKKINKKLARPSSGKGGARPKLTRKQIEDMKEKARIEREKKKAAEAAGVVEPAEDHFAVEENPNRALAEFVATSGIAVTDTIDEAIAVLNDTEGAVDMHPERRRKARYNAFEERRMAELKEEYKSLRRTQLKEMIWKEWQKSPENPEAGLAK
eukprot:Rmarinus@m.15978